MSALVLGFRIMKGGNRNSDFTKIITKEHEGKWIALSPDQKKVIAFSDDFRELSKKVKGQKVVYTRALRSDTHYAF